MRGREGGVCKTPTRVIGNNKIAVFKRYLRRQMYLLHANALLSVMTLETGNLIYGGFVRPHTLTQCTSQ